MKIELSDEMNLALSSLRDSHRQLFFQPLNQFQSWDRELIQLLQYCGRSWRLFFKLLLKEDHKKGSEKMDSWKEQISDFNRRAWELQYFFKTANRVMENSRRKS